MTTSTAVLVPSLGRPHRLQALVENIEAVTSEPHQLMFCVSDDESKAVLDRLGVWYLDDSADDDHRYVTRMNKLARQASSHDAVFFGSDDYIFHPNWLSEALAVLESGPQLVVVNDMHNPSGTAALMGIGYLDLAVFDSPGDAFHGGYMHNYADTEMFYTASIQGQLARAERSIVEHLHPSWSAPNALPWDDTYRNSQQHWGRDAALYQSRIALINAWFGVGQ